MTSPKTVTPDQPQAVPGLLNQHQALYDQWLENALRLARPIIETVHTDASGSQDDDWQAETKTALEAIDAALAARPVLPIETPAEGLRVDFLASWLHKEVEWPEHTYPAYTWPEDEGDTGKREGGYVKILPKYVVEEFRGIARRLLVTFAQTDAVASTAPAPLSGRDGSLREALADLIEACEKGDDNPAGLTAWVCGAILRARTTLAAFPPETEGGK